MGTSRPVPAHMGARIAPAVILAPQGRTKASAISSATTSMPRVSRLRPKKPPSRSRAGSPMPTEPPVSQMTLRVM
ncbi:hypothetical protein [Streptosporangium pseudovulgare]|uniref:hypothetical protein n=1 Tax=Streptosporangium pseudovulgare TaxID=35765 RepID=UPI00167055A9|nr:hypothetical protein [Streptosporangium pseudovulgare]